MREHFDIVLMDCDMPFVDGYAATQEIRQWERQESREALPILALTAVFRQLAAQLLLTYALRNADCHAKNLALLYTSRQDVHLSPVYDMLTTAVYEGYQHNPPAISFMGKKTWLP